MMVTPGQKHRLDDCRICVVCRRRCCLCGHRNDPEPSRGHRALHCRHERGLYPYARVSIISATSSSIRLSFDTFHVALLGCRTTSASSETTTP